ncbi:hypothetical protein BV898_03261 [Hypsibius exemplaris]|uniref:Uncharacterized protein n=1 Tax=Hypsibius exemplaris TaxID=2072580 RepID=A0A1W0X5G6_HYPEX|nr:hypothetical protein BV898_03261 [Hypsibius exemplaris]
MEGRRWALRLILLQCCFVMVHCQNWDPNFYRIEVQLERFEGGRIHNGKYCDTFTKCDPMIYTAFDLDRPFATYPGSVTNPQEFKKVFEAENLDVINMGTLLTKNICDRRHLPNQVTLRVEILDYDYFTAKDLIDNLDCTFRFAPTERDMMSWSGTESCRAMRRPGQTRLFFKWRIFPIHSGECHTSGILSAVPITSTSTTTTSTTTSTSTSTTSTPTTTTTATTTEEPTQPTTTTEEWTPPPPSDEVLQISEIINVTADESDGLELEETTATADSQYSQAPDEDYNLSQVRNNVFYETLEN